MDKDKLIKMLLIEVFSTYCSEGTSFNIESDKWNKELNYLMGKYIVENDVDLEDHFFSFSFKHCRNEYLKKEEKMIKDEMKVQQKEYMLDEYDKVLSKMFDTATKVPDAYFPDELINKNTKMINSTDYWNLSIYEKLKEYRESIMLGGMKPLSKELYEFAKLHNLDINKTSKIKKYNYWYQGENK